ncbi:hypothetical protein FFM54_06340 [Burkholderia pseudomallei]|nr:hypothetical protein FFM54_06340 [Burkholderia pseudomallei]
MIVRTGPRARRCTNGSSPCFPAGRRCAMRRTACAAWSRAFPRLFAHPARDGSRRARRRDPRPLTRTP